MAQDKSPDLPQPLRAAASVLRKVPGTGTVTRVAGGALDKVGAVPPRGRRMVVYTGAGVLGLAGVVEWPVALTGAAVAWLTQPRPGERMESTSGTAVPADGTSAKAPPARGTVSTARGTVSTARGTVSTARGAASALKGKATAAGGTTARAARATTKAATKGVASTTAKKSKAGGAKEGGAKASTGGSRSGSSVASGKVSAARGRGKS